MFVKTSANNKIIGVRQHDLGQRVSNDKFKTVHVRSAEQMLISSPNRYTF